MPIPERTFGCSWEPLSADDLPDLANLISAIEYMDGASHRHTLLDLAAALADPSLNLAEDTVLLRADGSPVAFGWNRVPALDDPVRTVQLVGGCHPSWRHRGVGAVLLDWQQRRAAEWDAHTRRPGFGSLHLVGVAPLENVRENTLFRQAGFVPQRWFHDLHQNFDPQAEAWHVVPVDGVTLQPWSDEVASRVQRVHLEIDQETRPPLPPDPTAWRDPHDLPEFREDLSWVALAGDQVVGYALNNAPDADDEIGWTERLAARNPWRRHGLMGALLATSLNSMRDAGLVGAGISVDTDSETGVRPYRALGYGVAETHVWYVRNGVSG